MKILLVNEFYTPNLHGGAEISCQLLAETLSEMGHSVFVLTTGKTNKIESNNGVKVYYCSISNLYWPFEGTNKNMFEKILWHVIDSFNVFMYSKISKVMEEIKPDIIHTNVISSFSCIVWNIAKAHKIPIVHTLRDYYLLCYKTSMFNNQKNCTNQCLGCKLSSIPKKHYSKYVSAVVGISNFILDKHLSLGYFQNADSFVVPNSIKKSSSFSDTRQKIIGFIGSVSPSKGVERLIRDFLSLENNEYKLQIAGKCSNEYKTYLQNKYNSTRVEFIGRVKADDFMQRISLLVVPSEWEEPFGRVVVEAMSNRCPVLVSNKGGMPEMINNSVGYVFNLEEKDSLIVLLQKFVLGILKFNFSKMNLEKYSLDNVANKYLVIYEKAKQTYSC